MLRTERLWLRNLCPADTIPIAAYRKDPDCARYQRWETVSMEAVADFVSRFSGSVFLSEEEEQHYAFCCGEELTGDLSVFYSLKDRCVTLGITVAPEHQRKGYAREILAAVIAEIRRKYLGLDLVALIHPENGPSIALFESLGFYRECYAPSIDSLVYVIDGTAGA